MQINVLISTSDESETPTLLVLPYGMTNAIPRHLQNLTWRHLATTTIDDTLLGGHVGEVEVGLSDVGYALVRIQSLGLTDGS
jgi:hypothetical protein